MNYLDEGYRLVDVSEDVEERAPRGKYAAMLLEFEENHITGEKKEVRQPDGSMLPDHELKKMYQGLLQAKRYQLMKGTDIQVQIQRKDGQLFLIRK